MIGTDRDIVLSSRIRLARNINGLADTQLIETELYREFANNPNFRNFSVYKIDDVGELNRILLKERKIITMPITAFIISFLAFSIVSELPPLVIH